MVAMGKKCENSYIFLNLLSFNKTNYAITGVKEIKKEKTDKEGRKKLAQLENMKSRI